MTTVEELRDNFYKDMVVDIENQASAWGTSEYMAEKKMQRVKAELDALIVASHAEGVAEEREKLVHCKQCVFGLPDGNPAHDYVRTCIDRKSVV